MLCFSFSFFSFFSVTFNPLLLLAARAIALLLLSSVHASFCLVCAANQIRSLIALCTFLLVSPPISASHSSAAIHGSRPASRTFTCSRSTALTHSHSAHSYRAYRFVTPSSRRSLLYRTLTGLTGSSSASSSNLPFSSSRRCSFSFSVFSSAVCSPASLAQFFPSTTPKLGQLHHQGCLCRRRFRDRRAMESVSGAPGCAYLRIERAATLRLQAGGLTLSPYLIACLPYVVCLLCVIVASMREAALRMPPSLPRICRHGNSDLRAPETTKGRRRTLP